MPVVDQHLFFKYIHIDKRFFVWDKFYKEYPPFQQPIYDEEPVPSTERHFTIQEYSKGHPWMIIPYLMYNPLHV